MSSMLRARLARLCSLLALGAGALLLLADSADCPDGYAGATWNASFASTCPADLVPATGSVHLTLANGNNPDEAALLRDLRAAGLKVAAAQVQTGGGGNTCAQSGFRLELDAASGGPRYCTRVSFDGPSQEVTCTTTPPSATALRLGRRDLSDASSSDEDATADAAGDAAAVEDADATAPVEPADASAAAPPTTCTITFTTEK